MKVVFFHRKPRPGDYSIEKLFRQLREALPADVDKQVVESRYFSNGIFKRLYNGIEAAFRQGEINHITGDVHFLALFLNKRKTILTIHDIGAIQGYRGLQRLLFKWFWIILPIRTSAMITTVSEATRQHLLSLVQIPPEKITVIHNPVFSQFTAVPKPFNSVRPVILQIGTKVNKNLPRLFQALEGLNCQLVVVGHLDAAAKNDLQQRRIDYKNQEDVSEAELLNLYAQCDLVSFVSTSEGFGLPIIEANAIGRPVITSNCSSMPEIARDAALLVDPRSVAAIREGIQKITRDENLREQLVQRGFENCKRFTREAIAKQYYDLYRQINASNAT